MERAYCTLAELEEDLNLPGVKSEAALMRHIRAASQFVERELGQFIPTVETLYFKGEDVTELLVRPLLSVTSLTNGGVALSASDYALEPGQRMWKNGPYSLIRLLDTGSAGAWSESDQGVVIAGRWGKYEEAVSVPVSAVSLATVGETSLVVSDGGLVSPGMVLLIESEHVFVEATGAVSDSTANLGAACTADDEELTLTDGTKVKTGEVIKVGFEQMKVLDIQTNTVLVSRGWNETRRAAHLISVDVYVYRTFTIQRGVNGTTAAVHSSAAVSQYLAPGDVNYLCRQVAALMHKKALTGFMGRSGNDDLGTGFWVNEFPKNQVDAVRSNYFWGGR